MHIINQKEMLVDGSFFLKKIDSKMHKSPVHHFMSFDKGTHNQTLSKTERLTRKFPYARKCLVLTGWSRTAPLSRDPKRVREQLEWDLREGSEPRTLRWTRAWHV